MACSLRRFPFWCIFRPRLLYMLTGGMSDSNSSRSRSIRIRGVSPAITGSGTWPARTSSGAFHREFLHPLLRQTIDQQLPTGMAEGFRRNAITLAILDFLRAAASPVGDVKRLILFTGFPFSTNCTAAYSSSGIDTISGQAKLAESLFFLSSCSGVRRHRCLGHSPDF